VRFIPVMRVLVDPLGTPLAPGLRVRALPSGQTSLTGFDGYAEINAGAEDQRLLVGTPGSGCVVDLTGVNLEVEGQEPLVCTPATIANDQSESRAVATKASRKPARTSRGNAKARLPRSALLASTFP
ncbi:MAG: hypothetical protein ACK4NZ_14725, partial [Tsuneonella sp.]